MLFPTCYCSSDQVAILEPFFFLGPFIQLIMNLTPLRITSIVAACIVLVVSFVRLYMVLARNENYRNFSFLNDPLKHFVYLSIFAISCTLILTVNCILYGFDIDDKIVSPGDIQVQQAILGILGHMAYTAMHIVLVRSSTYRYMRIYYALNAVQRPFLSALVWITTILSTSTVGSIVFLHITYILDMEEFIKMSTSIFQLMTLSSSIFVVVVDLALSAIMTRTIFKTCNMFIRERRLARSKVRRATILKSKLLSCLIVIISSDVLAGLLFLSNSYATTLMAQSIAIGHFYTSLHLLKILQIGTSDGAATSRQPVRPAPPVNPLPASAVILHTPTQGDLLSSLNDSSTDN